MNEVDIELDPLPPMPWALTRGKARSSMRSRSVMPSTRKLFKRDGFGDVTDEENEDEVDEEDEEGESKLDEFEPPNASAFQLA